MKHIKRFNESRDDDNYVNYLLDKINKKGIDSLSDSEKNRLDKITSDNIEDRTLRIINGEIYIGDVLYDRFISPDYKKHIYPVSDAISDANRMFFSKLGKMNISNIQINDKIYSAELIDEMSGKHLKVGDYIISPFYEGQKGICVNHNNDYWLYELDSIPTSIQQMNNFIQEFFKTYIKEIIR